MSMNTNRPTQNDELAGTPTLEPTSRNRFDGNVWYERLMSQSAPASSDGARFAAGLDGLDGLNA